VPHLRHFVLVVDLFQPMATILSIAGPMQAGYMCHATSSQTSSAEAGRRIDSRQISGVFPLQFCSDLVI